MTLRLDRYEAREAQTLIDELVDVYLEVYADAGEFFSEDRFRRQISGHMSLPGWQVVAAREADNMVGYIYGFPLPAETKWWRGLLTTVPDDFTTETGHRTFAVSELLVRAGWRGRGIAHELHDDLLCDRTEERATLLVEPDNTMAWTAYQNWGWTKVAELRPSWEQAPLYHALLLPLPSGLRSNQGLKGRRGC